MFKKLLISAALALTFGNSAFAESYKIDTDEGHSAINFSVSHLGFSFLTGRFDKFTGSFEFDVANPEASSLNVEIIVGSINTNHGKRDNHLRSADFFDEANNATASFVSTGIKTTGDKTAVITGDLTIKGITKSVALDTVFIAEGEDPWGNYRAGFSGATTVNLSDYDMAGVLGDQEVVLTVSTEGIRQ